jgi:uncharacterized protein
MENDAISIDRDDEFTFGCHKGVACFNECCRDLNQFLTPYDILRLKNNLGISAGEFLNTYTRQHIGPETGLPIVAFKLDPNNEFKCPFVTEKGCLVYPDRPSSCRTYPIGRMAVRKRATGKITEQFALIRESYCLGCREEKTQTVRAWLASQELAEYNRMNDKMMEIIGLKMQLIKGPLDLKDSYLFQMACYDMDRFLVHILEKGPADNLDFGDDFIRTLEKDETRRLEFGFEWLKNTLFQQGKA